MTNWLIRQTVDLGDGMDASKYAVKDIIPVAYVEDQAAHTWEVTVMQDGEPADLTSYTCTAFFYRHYDGQTPYVNGTINDNVVRVILPKEAYSYEGRVDCKVNISSTGYSDTITLSVVSMNVGHVKTTHIIDPGQEIPTTVEAFDSQLQQLATLNEQTSAIINGYAGGLQAVQRDSFGEIDDAGDIAGWESGRFNSTQGNNYGKNQADGTYVRTSGAIYVYAGTTVDVDDNTTYKFQVALYSDAEATTCTFVKSASTAGPYTVTSNCYMRIAIAKKDGSTQSTTAIKSHFDLDIIGDGESVMGLRDEVKVKVEPENIDWVVSQLVPGTGALSYTASNGMHYVATSNFIRALKGSTISIQLDEGESAGTYVFNVAHYSAPNVASFTSFRSADSAAYTVPEDCYIRFGIALAENRTALQDTGMAKHLVYDITQELSAKTARQEEELHAVERSPFYRDVLYGPCVLNEYYHGGRATYETFPTGGGPTLKNYTYASYIGVWDELAERYPDYITKFELSERAYDNQIIYGYKLTQNQWEQSDRKQPKVIIVSGQHGNEKCAPFGLYYFVRDLCENWDHNASYAAINTYVSDYVTSHSSQSVDDYITDLTEKVTKLARRRASVTTLDYIRNHVTLIIVPVANPSGFNVFDRDTAHEVDMNRNYDYDATRNWSPGGSGKGTAPFSEPETQAIRDLVNDNLDASLLIDFHTQGEDVVSNYTKLTWCSFDPDIVAEAFGQYLYRACCWHVEEITQHFIADYGITPDGDEVYGTVTLGTPDTVGLPSLKNWAKSIGIAALTYEGFPGFPAGSWRTGACKAPAQQANSELIGNFLRTALSAFAKITK